MKVLKDAKLWKLVMVVVEEAYACLDEFPEEEKWGLAAKLRGRAGDAATLAAEALGALDPRDVKWSLGKARANLFAVQAVYEVAYKTGQLTPHPESMVKIEAALKEIEALTDKASGNIPKWLKEMGTPEERQFP
jgi:hypothetical protein